MEYLRKAKAKIEEYYQEKLGQHIVTQEEKQEVENAKQELEIKKKNLVEPKMSFLFRIFRRKQYIKKLEEYDKKQKEIKELSKKISNMDFDIERKEATAENLEEEKKKELAVFEGMDFNFSKNTSIKQKSLLDNERYNASCKNIGDYIDKLLNEYPNLAEDVEFMKSCVEFDMNYIEKDKTNSPEVYDAYLEQYIENNLDKVVLGNSGYKPLESAKIIEDFTKMKEALSSEVSLGMYKIPNEYIYERIKKAQENDKLNEPKKVYEYVFAGYEKYNGKMTSTSGEKLLELFEEAEDYYYYIYDVDSATSGSDGSKETVETIKKNGIPIAESGKIEESKVICINGSEVLDLYSFLGNFDEDKDKIIARIPKTTVESEQPIIGYDSESVIGRILPEYIVGSVKKNNYTSNEMLESPEFAAGYKQYEIKMKNGEKPKKQKEIVHSAE